MNDQPLTPAERRRALEFIAYRRQYQQIDFFEPYPKQIEFFSLGDTKRERLLTSGNQLGKTQAGGAEACWHLTGTYPVWWQGRRWDRPTKGWICGETSVVVRDTQQKKLCGEPGVEELHGSGLVPKDRLLGFSLARGVTNAMDTIQVRHVSGGISIGRFKSYEQGRAKFQGESLDWCWDDEEPPMEIYSEQLARLAATGGLIYTTFTSMNGPTTLVNRFYNDSSPDRAMVRIGLIDAKHIPASEHAKIIAGYEPYEREARVHGGILRGHGRIFPFGEEIISEPSLRQVPAHWAKIWGIDIGIGHPFAAVLLLWDRDIDGQPGNDIIHVHHAFRMVDGLPINHWAAMKPIGAALPVAWPKDAGDREKGSGEPIIQLYKAQGARVLEHHATFEDGSISTEAGVMEMLQRMRTGRFKVASHLTQWFEEFRNYHRKDGQIVKRDDDLLSATRVGLMMKRFGRPVGLGGQAAPRQRSTMARDVDFDVFNPGDTMDVFAA